MFTFSFDKNAGLMVGWLTTRPYFNEEEDYAVLIDCIDRFQSSGKPGDPFKIILMVDPEVPMPNATWRKQFAKTRTKTYFPFLFVTVTKSPLLRGVLTMVNWVSPPPTGSGTNSVETFDEAVQWLEDQTKRKLGSAKKLLEEVSSRKK